MDAAELLARLDRHYHPRDLAGSWGGVDKRIVEAVLDRSTSAASPVHGVRHWQRVTAIGLDLARRTPGADPYLVALFGLFHDALRPDDGHDLQHGIDAALLACELAPLLALDERRLEILAHALSFHPHGFIARHATAGCCWDADRLELARVGITPNPNYLSTAAGLERLGVKPSPLIARRVPDGATGFRGQQASLGDRVSVAHPRVVPGGAAPTGGHHVMPTGVYVFRHISIAAHQVVLKTLAFGEGYDVWKVDIGGLMAIPDPWPTLSNEALLFREPIDPSRLSIAYAAGQLPPLVEQTIAQQDVAYEKIDAVEQALLDGLERRKVLRHHTPVFNLLGRLTADAPIGQQRLGESLPPGQLQNLNFVHALQRLAG